MNVELLTSYAVLWYEKSPNITVDYNGAIEGISVPYTLYNKASKTAREFCFYDSVNTLPDILKMKIQPAYAKRID